MTPLAALSSLRTTLSRLPRGVWMLGLVSLFMDLSSELIHALLPIFLVGSLGVSLSLFGLIEGAAEGLAAFMKLFSGVLSDHLRKRKMLALLGYGLAALSKPLFPLSAGASGVLAARLLDRLGKGLRGAPRDALVADITPPSLRGAAYGLRQSLDTLGAVLGPVAAALALVFLLGDVRAALWWAVPPALLAVLVLFFGVEESPRATTPSAAPSAAPSAPRAFDWRAASDLPAAFWLWLAASFVLQAARMGEGFLLLRGAEAGLSAAQVPLLLALMSLVYALVAYPAGHLSDRIARPFLLMAGFLVLGLAQGVLALGSGLFALIGAVMLWGLHMGLTQGVMAALVADLAPASRRGTAFGFFHLTSAAALLLASLLAGVLWQHFGSAVAFGASAALSLGGVALALMVIPRRMFESAGR